LSEARRPARALALGAALLLAALQFAGWPQPFSWAQAARSASVQALAHGPSFAWAEDPARASALVLGDELASTAGTRAQHAPLLALIAALPARGLEALGLEPGSAAMERALAFLIAGLPSALAAAALASLCAAVGASATVSALWGLVALACTAWLPQALVLGQHGAAAAAAIGALAALHSGRMLSAGLLAGLAAGIDFPHAAALLVFFVAACALRGAPGALRYVCGTLPPVALAIGLGLPSHATGAQPLAELPFALLPGGARGEELPHTEHAFAALELAGWDGLLAREPLALLGLLAALLLVCRPRFGADRAPAQEHSPKRAVERDSRVLLATAGAAALAVALGHLLPCAARGQAAHARAWMASVEPLLVLPLAAVTTRGTRGAWHALGAALLCAALLVSAVHAGLASRAPWSRLTLGTSAGAPSTVPGAALASSWRERATHAWLRHAHAPDAASAARAPLELLAQHEARLLAQAERGAPERREARLREGLARLQAVIDRLEARSSVAPAHVHALWRAGRLHEALGERALARRAFERALVLDANFAPARAALDAAAADF